MRLAPFPLDEELHVSLQDLIDVINRFAGEEEYAVKIARSKAFKKDDVNDVAYVSCDRDENSNRNSEGRN